MRKKISCLVIIVMLFRIFCLSAVAAPTGNVDGWSPSGGNNSLSSEQPFWVAQKDQVNRYAVDVEYESMSIPVTRAEWNVNTYHYEVTMGHTPPPGYTGDDNFAPFDFDIKLINHSDLPITVQITTKADGMNIEQQTSVMDNGYAQVTKHEIPKVENQAHIDKAQRKPNHSVTNIALTPTNGWESLINTLIANGATNGSSYTVGNVSIVITKN